MYEHNEDQLIMPDEFFLPFEGHLNPQNRWVLMASYIPWREVEMKYKKRLGDLTQGNRAYPARLALGSLIIKEFLGLSDEGTVEVITENPYLQYFIGLDAFQMEAPFDASSMTHFRKRFDLDYINEMNEIIIHSQEKTSSDQNPDREPSEDDDDPTGGSSTKDSSTPENPRSQSRTNHGNLLVDATCTPANIAYPTDINLLNEAREKLENIIDILHKPFIGKERKQTYIWSWPYFSPPTINK